MEYKYDEVFPVLITTVISFTDGQTQYLLPEGISLLIKGSNNEFSPTTLHDLYISGNINHVAKSVLGKELNIKIIERMKDFELPWSKDKEILVGNLLIKNLNAPNSVSDGVADVN